MGKGKKKSQQGQRQQQQQQQQQQQPQPQQQQQAQQGLQQTQQQGLPQPGPSHAGPSQPPQQPQQGEPSQGQQHQQKKKQKKQQLQQQELQQRQEFQHSQVQQQPQPQSQQQAQAPQQAQALQQSQQQVHRPSQERTSPDGGFPSLGAPPVGRGWSRGKGRGAAGPGLSSLRSVAESLPPVGAQVKSVAAGHAQSPGAVSGGQGLGFPTTSDQTSRGLGPWTQQRAPQQAQQPTPQQRTPQQPTPQQPTPQRPSHQHPPQPQPHPQQQTGQRQTTPTTHQQQPAQRGPPSTGAARPVQERVERAGLQIPTRASIEATGMKGRLTRIRTNHLALNIQQLRTKTALHYDVSIDPDKPKRLLRRVVEEFRLKHFPDRYPAFDGRKNMYSATSLPFDHKREFRDTVNIIDPEMQREKEYKVVIKYATQVDLTSLSTYMTSGTSLDAPQQAIQVLDVVLRCAPALWFVPVGRSHFTPPSGKVEPLGDGYEIWYGLFQSVNLGWQPFVNVDVVHKGFPRSQPVIDAIREICDAPGRPLDLSRSLSEYQLQDVKKFLLGLKVDYMLPKNPSSKRTYKVNSVVGPASTLSFILDNGRKLTVQQYFEQEKHIPLKYYNLPCLHVGSLKRPNPIYVPIEFCTVTAGQVTQKKLNERQTANMIKKAATSTMDREHKIKDALAKARFNQSQQVREFGLQVNENFQEIKARVLNPPQLEYRNKEGIVPQKGVWPARPFLDGKTLTKWIVLVLDSRIYDEDIGKFISQFIQQGSKLGMSISEPLPTRKIDSRRIRSDLEPFLRERAKEQCELVVVVVPERGNDYAIVKQIAELTVGVLTQCVKGSTMSRRMNYATAQNILLKVNSKLNGVNHSMHNVSRPKIFEKPIMIVGADVTHPSPDETKIPSVAAVCASHDPNAFRYNTQFRLQPPRTEIIQDLEEIMRQHLLFFYKKTGLKKPFRILFYRDGVSEGQFQQVLDNELTAIRSACSKLEPDYKPAITFLVVQKRHHTRFFPIDPRDRDGKNCNVMPGTIVDTTITHPTERDFYLVSHASIQGVSRPTKYHCLWDDNKLSEDELQELTYFLCHMFSRCNRSVSYPAPTYYAHLAAYRARVYLSGQNLDRVTDQRLRTELLAQLQAQSPMYFV